MNDDYLVVNLKSLLQDNRISEEGSQLLNEFSCEKNLEVESFLKKNAVLFCNTHKTVTYLVFDSSDSSFVGYFALALKAYRIDPDPKVLTNEYRKKIEWCGEFDKLYKMYTVPVYLIAQIGKNYSLPHDKQICGNKLIELAEETIKQIQFMIGVGFAFLECEEKKVLTSFYENNNYRYYGHRLLNKGNSKLLQYLKRI